MQPLTKFLQSHSLFSGILLMFFLTWPIDLANSGVLPFQVPFVVAILVGWGFVVASLLMTGLTLGKAEVVALLKRFLIWRVHWQWYLVACLLYPVILGAAVLLNVAFSGRSIDFSTVIAYRIFGPTVNLRSFILPFLIFDALTNGEEIGWRGYVLPRFQARYNALVASLLVGAIWGLWHLPKFLAPGNTGAFGWFLLKIMADAVLYTWLYNNTQGSLLLVTLFHATGNTAGVFLPVANTLSGTNLSTLIIQIALEIFVVIGVIWSEGFERLSRTAAKQMQIELVQS